MFSKILIANRGEIALRIIRACQELGIKTVAIYSTADANSLHVRMADESVCVGPPSSKESYLKMDRIISAADITGAEAIHPGVGFLSENATFAAMVEEHGLIFIGPTSQHIAIMADKIEAKHTMRNLGVPLIKGSEGTLESEEEAMEVGKKIGFPLIVKATCGGGGKGMKVVRSEDELVDAYKLAKLEAKANFGNDSVFMERYLENPRHIEVQILADSYGNCIHLGERDCSIQRNHQKIWEEAPSPAITEEERKFIGDLSVKAIKNMGYRGVGTMEYLYENGQFFFMEMNTRIQVEHPITELITGIDLIKYQIRVANGEKLDITQDDVKLSGHAIECRINAEDPLTFMPSPGTVTFYHPPGGKDIRIDSHLYHGYTIPPFYDSLIAKLIVYGNTRQEALMRLDNAIKEYIIEGPKTLLPLHARLVRDKDIQSGQYDIKWLERKLKDDFNQQKDSQNLREKLSV